MEEAHIAGGRAATVHDPVLRQQPLVPRHDAPTAVNMTEQPTFMGMIQSVVMRGGDLAVIDRLWALKVQVDEYEAKKAFVSALAAAKAELPTITKNRHVGFDSKKAGAARTDYWHEDLAEITTTVTPVLAKHGLAFRFDTVNELNLPVVVTCILFHRDGHEVATKLIGPRDASGNKNDIQQVGSTITYLQRYTLKAALGLAAARDDDGAASGEPMEGIEQDLERLQIRVENMGLDSSRLSKFFDAIEPGIAKGWDDIRTKEQIDRANYLLDEATRIEARKAAKDQAQ